MQKHKRSGYGILGSVILKDSGFFSYKCNSVNVVLFKAILIRALPFHITGKNLPLTISYVCSEGQKVTFFFHLFSELRFSVEKNEKIGYNLHAQGLLSVKA